MFLKKFKTKSRFCGKNRLTCDREEFEKNLKKHGTYDLYQDAIKKISNSRTFAGGVNYLEPYKMHVCIVRPPFGYDFAMKIVYIRYEGGERRDLVECFFGTSHEFYIETENLKTKISEERAKKIKSELNSTAPLFV